MGGPGRTTPQERRQRRETRAEEQQPGRPMPRPGQRERGPLQDEPLYPLRFPEMLPQHEGQPDAVGRGAGAQHPRGQDEALAARAPGHDRLPRLGKGLHGGKKPEHLRRVPGLRRGRGGAYRVADGRIGAEGAMAIVDIINSPKTVAIQNNEQKVDFVVKQLTDRGLNIDRSLVSSLIYDKQCVKGFLVLNDALAKEGIPGFINMQGRGKVPAVSFIYPLTNAIRRGETNTTFDSLFMQTVNKISDVHAGDAIVIYTPWMGSNEIKNPGHIAQVLFTGTHSDGSPYMIIFDTNGDGKGTTAIRIINNLEDFISQEAKDTQQYYPKSEPIFALIRPESQMMATP